MQRQENIVLLFDEQGTPTFRSDKETDLFLGVGVTYKAADEKNLFTECDQLFGLSISKPRKNKDINNIRATKISYLIKTLSIQIVVKSFDLSNPELKYVTELYAEVGGIVSQKHRNVRKRPASQILHSQILNFTLFESITRFIEQFRIDAIFEIYIDDWSIPQSYRDIAINLTSKSLQDKINELLHRSSFNANILVSPIDLLIGDSKRKRFIDVITSVISRAFLGHNNPRYSENPLNNILSKNSNIYQNMTDEVIVLFRNLMNEVLRK